MCFHGNFFGKAALNFQPLSHNFDTTEIHLKTVLFKTFSIQDSFNTNH